MPRRPRMHFENCIYHVYNRGNNKAKVFFSDSDYLKFLDMLFEISNELNVIIYFYSLIPNHFHLVLRTIDDNISLFLKKLIQRYTQYINWKYKRVGSVFQKRTKTIVVFDENYLYNLFLYINLNSLKHNVINDPFKYKWSSLDYYIHPDRIPSKYEILGRGILEFYKTNNIITPNNIQEILLEKIVEVEKLPLPDVVYSCFYGDKKLIKQHLEKIDRRAAVVGVNKYRRWTDRKKVSKKIVDVSYTDIPKEYIKDNKLLRRYKLKPVLVYLDKMTNLEDNVVLANKYSTSTSNISKMINRFKTKLQKDIVLRNIIDTILKNLN